MINNYSPFSPHHSSVRLSSSYIIKVCDLYVIFFKVLCSLFLRKISFWLYTPESLVCLALKIAFDKQAERKVIDTYLSTGKNKSDHI